MISVLYRFPKINEETGKESEEKNFEHIFYTISTLKQVFPISFSVKVKSLTKITKPGLNLDQVPISAFLFF